MKYQGIIRISDVIGTVFERPLTSEEMVEILVDRKRLEIDLESAIGSMEGAAPRQKRKYEKREVAAPKVKVGKYSFAEHAPRRVAAEKDCCGSKGARHFKWCKQAGGTGVVGQKTEKLIRATSFSESTYDKVMDMLSRGVSTQSIIAEKGLDPDEIRRVQLASDYESYARG